MTAMHILLRNRWRFTKKLHNMTIMEVDKW